MDRPSVRRSVFAVRRPKTYLCFVLACLATATAVAEEMPQPVTKDHYNETLVTPEPIDGDSLSLDPEPYINSEPWYELPARRTPWYYARFRGGGSYYSVPGETKFGGEYGGDVVVPMLNNSAGYANISLNHISEGTQVLGTVGIFQAPSRFPTGLTDRLGWLVFFDQYTDTRIDDLYLSSLRIGADFSLDSKTRIGVTYTEPLEEDDAEFVLFPGATVSVPLSQTRGIKAHLSHRFDSTLVGASIGYRDIANTVGYGGNVRHSFNDRLAAIANATYEDAGLWSGFVGFEVALGRPTNDYSDCAPRCRQHLQSGANEEIVRGGPKYTRYYFAPDGGIYPTVVKAKTTRGAKRGFMGNLLTRSEAWDYIDNRGYNSIADYNRAIAGMRRAMRMMQMQQMMIGAPLTIGDVNDGLGIDAATEPCDELVDGILRLLLEGDVSGTRATLISIGRQDCLGDPRLN